MTTKQFYDYITKRLTPEQALMKLLEGSLIKYEKLKFDEENFVHPVFIIAMASMDMGWDICFESDYEDIRGLTVGTKEYIQETIKNNLKDE